MVDTVEFPVALAANLGNMFRLPLGSITNFGTPLTQTPINADAQWGRNITPTINRLVGPILEPTDAVAETTTGGTLEVVLPLNYRAGVDIYLDAVCHYIHGETLGTVQFVLQNAGLIHPDGNYDLTNITQIGANDIGPTNTTITNKIAGTLLHPGDLLVLSMYTTATLATQGDLIVYTSGLTMRW